MKLRLAKLALFAAIATSLFAGAAQAAQCGNNAGGFERWKAQFAAEAKANGIGNRGLQALAGTSYATKTIYADRNQKSFNYSLQKFMQVRGSNAIISQGKSRKRANAKFFAALERKYGVPAGPLLAIHGMETGFGRFMGNANVMSAIATLAYDCRRSAFFTEHLYAALQLVDRGVLSSSTRGAMHGEVGHTQFLPGSVLRGLTEEEMEVYRRPYLKTGESRRPTLTWPREIPIEGEPADVVKIVSDYGEWMASSEVPKLLINAEPGAILTGPQREFCRTWPNQQEVTVKGIHFIQEDSPDEIGRAIAGWYGNL